VECRSDKGSTSLCVVDFSDWRYWVLRPKCDVFGQGEREISQIFRGWVEKTAPGSISVSVRSIWDNYETK
jgi:hypothetical protein